MADITMCRGENCKNREKCYRYTAPVDKYWQSVFTETPKEIPCEHFCLNDGCIDGRKINKWWKKQEGLTMLEREEILKAKRTLVQYCNEHNSDCSECFFAYRYEDGCGECGFRLYPYPVEWEEIDNE